MFIWFDYNNIFYTKVCAAYLLLYSVPCSTFNFEKNLNLEIVVLFFFFFFSFFLFF